MVFLRCACEGLEIEAKDAAFKFSGYCHCTQCRRTAGAPYWHGAGYFFTYKTGEDGKAKFDPEGEPGLVITKGKDTHLYEYALNRDKRGFCQNCGTMMYHAAKDANSGLIEDWRVAAALIDYKGPGASKERPEGDAAHIFTDSSTLPGITMDGKGKFMESPVHPPKFSTEPTTTYRQSGQLRSEHSICSNRTAAP